ncbi:MULTISPECIES: succinyldiaminopimelate transaminase [Marinobacter]|uniref:Succinyldiaminopimelate aminotransferase n=1 Tax=Marinobacter nauticus TaxID=2743 RepID=A0A368UP31_MARNT|nr:MULTISPECIES: succinyldiaminopimelate transaminase [Marinobacter]ERS89611.1 succinyldiaminopimelate aminotransferase [Marinobacter sp. C1S70]RBP69141.1 succinyldiaminopimelate aminotransferase [Marinobacter nauticus]RCW30546.1 succinyldiaminopimelate aminotransferase [Marinobacter nauticus]
MNPNLERLHPYPFEKLAKLKAGISVPEHLAPISLGIGEPKHPSPAFVKDVIADNLDKLANYPTTKGTDELRSAIAAWATHRFDLAPASLDPNRHVVPVNGTREAIFALVQAVVDAGKPATVVSPNPFYQIYEGAAFLAGATPVYLPCDGGNGFIPDFDAVPESVWENCQILFLCSPGNPSGAVIPRETLVKVIELADRHDFLIASDECYSELYPDEANPPEGLLQTCAAIDRHDFKRCVVFHSLSKRSNLPGLRSGFVAGDAEVLAGYLKYRTYHGCAMPIHNQLASIAAWNDEDHVRENRAAYRAKFEAVVPILREVMNVDFPDAGFYLWPETPMDDETFARELSARQNVHVLPGRYLSRTVNGHNPGENRVRMALVAPLEECVEAAKRIVEFVKGFKQ